MEATQESTQPYADPRRVGSNNSGLQEQDVADIICILHPNSRAAHDAVAATAEIAPQHILQRDELEYTSSDIAARDIALRLSSSVRDPKMGFTFGRNASRCDVLLSADDSAKRISNVHFRIYLTGDGIIMLQDISMNGTVVDNCRLRKNQKDNSRMLTSGSVIQVVNQPGDEVRFIVRIPSRDGYTVQYTENLIRYLERVHKHEADAKRKIGNVSAKQTVQWAIGNPYGMHWSGGSIYNVTGQIGKGAFATVYKLATKQHGVVYAAKELDKRRFMKNGVLDQKVDNEMKIIRDLRHVRYNPTPLTWLSTNSFSQISSNTKTTTSTTAGSTSSWSMFRAASCQRISRCMARSPRTWSKASPDRSCMRSSTFTSARSHTVISSLTIS